MRIQGVCLTAALAIAGLGLVGGEARALTLAEANLVDLMRESTSIVTASVTAVTDGFDRTTGLPYTEVTLSIRQTLRGDEQGTYTFRQLGLKQPRLSEDGTRKMLPIDGLPKFAEGEEVLLFLSRAAEWSGLRTTYGLNMGKFAFGPGRVENGLANEGLFRNVSVAAGLATDNDTRMLETEIGAVNPDTFLSFVQRAVDGQWVETCLMWDTVEGKNCARSDRREMDRPDTPKRVGTSNPTLQTIESK